MAMFSSSGTRRLVTCSAQVLPTMHATSHPASTRRRAGGPCSQATVGRRVMPKHVRTESAGSGSRRRSGPWRRTRRPWGWSPASRPRRRHAQAVERARTFQLVVDREADARPLVRRAASCRRVDPSGRSRLGCQRVLPLMPPPRPALAHLPRARSIRLAAATLPATAATPLDPAGTGLLAQVPQHETRRDHGADRVRPPRPAMSGAEPCTGSKIDMPPGGCCRADVADAADQAGGEVRQDVAEWLFGHDHLEAPGWVNQQQGRGIACWYAWARR